MHHLNRIAIPFGCVLLVTSVFGVPEPAMATTANVTFDLRGYASNSDGSITYDLNQIPGGGDVRVTWTMSVRVTGDNLGLAGYVVDLGVYEELWGWIAPHPFPDASDGSRSWVPAYKTGARSGGTLVQDGSSGGPGLSSVQKLGYQDTSVSYIAQMGAGFTDFTPFNKAGKTWVGNQTWGVGLDSRKSALLVDPNGLYDIETGYFDVGYDVAGWQCNQYRVQLLVTSAAVIQSGLNLNSGPTQIGIVWDVPKEDLFGGSFKFTPDVPEPATMLLLAGAGLLIRRRRI